MSRASTKAPARGFTLLEVMAAVALLGILYTVLARVAVEGLRAEGESARRLEAALIADHQLNQVYDRIYQEGAPTPLGRGETSEGEFKVTLDVTPFQVPLEWGLTAAEGVTPMIFAPTPDGEGVEGMRTLQLTVSWLEGAEERRVNRTIYLVDFNRAASLMASVAGSAPRPQRGEASETPEGSSAPSELDLELELP